MLMNVILTLMAVLTTVSTPLDLIDVVVELDTHWLLTDTPVEVYYGYYVSDSISAIGRNVDCE